MSQPIPIRRYTLILDGWAQPARLADPPVLQAAIAKVAKEAGMHLASVQISHFGGGGDKAGISAIGVITTSHIALHTWPELGFFLFDTVSCQSFSMVKISTVLMESLDVERICRRLEYDAERGGETMELRRNWSDIFTEEG